MSLKNIVSRLKNIRILDDDQKLIRADMKKLSPLLILLAIASLLKAEPTVFFSEDLELYAKGGFFSRMNDFSSEIPEPAMLTIFAHAAFMLLKSRNQERSSFHFQLTSVIIL
ncbi:hypothetical protein J6X96_06265 [bacterium]|nr:hypothetical protein [bacterium]